MAPPPEPSCPHKCRPPLRNRAWGTGTLRAPVSLFPCFPHSAPLCATSHMSDPKLGPGDTERTQKGAWPLLVKTHMKRSCEGLGILEGEIHSNLGSQEASWKRKRHRDGSKHQQPWLPPLSHSLRLRVWSHYFFSSQ
jgi:hypothetical protein